MSTEVVVYDHLDPCTYLPGRTARLPLRIPIRTLTGEEFDARLNQGDRRTGAYLYRPTCPACRACEPIRLDAFEFRPHQTQRRVLRKGNEALQTIVDSPSVDAQRVALYNAHRLGRGLAQADGEIDESGYAGFLTETCCRTLEIQYRLKDDGASSGRLIGVAICDQGRMSLSAVYCYYDPELARLSPGVYSVLKQIELCREWGLRYLYLGLYIADSPHMSYKARYLPHERLIEGQWRRFPGT